MERGKTIMKKYMTKPVLAVLAAATIIGGTAPILANASSLSGSPATKVVMNEEGKQVTRYNLKELAEKDPATLNLLLKTQADHLYIVVDKLNLDVKMQTFIEQNEAEWNRIYNQYYSDIYLEVRLNEEDQGFLSLTPETKENTTYLRGEVTEDVTKVVVVKPNGDTIEVVPTAKDTFTVSFAAVVSASPKYATVKAYVNDKLVDTREVQVNTGTVVDSDVVIHTQAVLDKSKGELKVNGVVSTENGKVVVTYDGETRGAGVKKLWEGVGSYSVTFKDAVAGKGKVLVEVYKDGKKLDSEWVEVVVTGKEEKPSKPDPAKPDTFTITGKAKLDAKDKEIEVEGKVSGYAKNKKAKLYVIAPDGNRHEVKVDDEGEFEAKLSYKNRSYSAKSVRLELVIHGKTVATADIPHGTPVNGEEKGKGKEKDKDKEKKHPNGNAYGYWKKHGNDDHGDDDRDDERDDD